MIDNGDDSIVFFADEAGSWQVGIEWEATLAAYFASRAAISEPEEYARAVLRAIDDFADHDPKPHLTLARRPASREQVQAINRLVRAAKAEESASG